MTKQSEDTSQSTFLRIWGQLTKPTNTIINPNEQRQAQFLAGLLLTLLPLGLIFILLPRFMIKDGGFLQDPFSLIVLLAIGVLCLAYGLSRTRHYKIAAPLAVMSITGIAFLIPLTGTQSFHFETVMYLTVAVLLSSVLLSIRATLVLVVVQIGGFVALSSISSNFSWDNATWVRLGYISLISVGILLLMYYRNLVDKERQAELQRNHDELQDAHAELEKRVAERTTELQQMSVDLQREITDHQFAERVISETYAQLEQRIAERTSELSDANKLLQEQIAERIRAEAAEREHRILAEGLRETAESINKDLELDAILDRILLSIERILPYDSASIMLIEDGVARVVRGRGFNETSMPIEEALALRFPVERHGNLQQMFETGRPIIIPDTEQDTSWYFLSETRWIRSYVAAPIRIEGKVIGFVNLDSRKVNTFNETHAENLLAFADQAGIAIRNAELFTAIRSYAADLETRVAERTAEVEREQAQLQAVMDSMNEGLFGYIQGEKESTYINAALVRMMGYSAEEWNFNRLKPTGFSKVEFEERLEALQESVSQKGIWQSEWRLQRKDGSEFDAYLTTSRIDDQDGVPIGAVTLIRDISQEKILQEVKSRFVANASHELRTPLTNLITRLYLLRKQPERLEEHLLVLDRVASRMRNLVEDLLDYSRFERGVIPLKSRPIDMRELVRDVVQMQQAEASNKHIQLESNLPDEPMMIFADPERINQAITNLVFNALFYTPEGGMVQVELGTEPGAGGSKQVVIQVKDNGPGIPDTLLPNIFLPFYRGSENNKGTGLGLAIAKEVIERHGGHISVESEAGRGSNFVMRLPFLTEGH